MNPKLPYRNQLTIWAQKTGHPEPEYETTSTGPCHEPQFRTCLRVAGKMIHGFGPRKVLAETDASERACRDLLGRKCRRTAIAFMDVDRLDHIYKYENEDIPVRALMSMDTREEILERIESLNNVSIVVAERTDRKMILEVGKAIGSGTYDEIHVVGGDDFSDTLDENDECCLMHFYDMRDWILYIEDKRKEGCSFQHDIDSIIKTLCEDI